MCLEKMRMKKIVQDWIGASVKWQVRWKQSLAMSPEPVVEENREESNGECRFELVPEVEATRVKEPMTLSTQLHY